MLVNTDRCEFSQTNTSRVPNSYLGPVSNHDLHPTSPGFFVGGERHDSIFLSNFLEVFYQLRSRWPCAHVLRHWVVLAHTFPAAAHQRGLGESPGLHLWKDFMWREGFQGERLPRWSVLRFGGSGPVDIILLIVYCVIYVYDWKGQYSQQGAFLGEDSWFNNQDALQKTGTWKF